MYSQDSFTGESKGGLPTRAYKQKTVFVVVNGISTGRYIAPFLRGLGYDAIVHVLTRGCEATNIPHTQEDYVLNLKESDFSSLQQLLDTLAAYQIKAIIPGSESAVRFVDEMNYQLHMPYQNEYKLIDARTNKYEMQEAMKRAGLKHAKQVKASDVDTVIRWAKTTGYPIVIKPLSSAGSDGVHFCDNEEDARKAIGALLGKPDVFGNINHSVVAQEKLVGDEFMVNTVSCGKHTYVVDIIHSVKETLDGNPLYDYTVNIPRSDSRFEVIAEYVKGTLNAVGLQYGAAHTEVILTKNGPTLVEVNARLIGTLDMSATFKALGQNHVTTLMNTYLDPEFLPLLIKRGQEKLNEGFALTSFFIAKWPVQIRNRVPTEMIERIKGYHSMKFGVKQGGKLAKTTDVFNMPGVVFFVGKTLEEVLDSHQEFRRIENQFYRELEKAPKSSPAAFFTDRRNLDDSTRDSLTDFLTRKNIGLAVGAMVLCCLFCRSVNIAEYVPGLRR